MTQLTWDIHDFHWIMQVVDTMDSGLVVIDRDYNVCVWNSFMQSYSGIHSQDIMGFDLFQVCPNLPENWLKTKVSTSATLQTKSFSSWEDRPYLFEFRNYSPVSQGLKCMYQDIVITPLRSPSSEITHFSIMINDVSEIARSKILLRESNEHLAEVSRTDGLTGLYNRAYWEVCLNNEFTRTQLLEQPCSLVMFDIDYFKRVNDTYGHTMGDKVIRRIAKLLSSISRDTDICGRYGGEEFGVILPNTTIDQAHYFAERLRTKVAKECLCVDHKTLNITISLGVSELLPTIGSSTDWLNSVDLSLYKSKGSGRNRTTLNFVCD